MFDSIDQDPQRPFVSSDIHSVTFSSEKEMYLAQVIPPTHEKWLKFQLSQLAALKLQLEPDPANINKFLQQNAYIRGQMVQIRYALDCSELAKQTLAQASQE